MDRWRDIVRRAITARLVLGDATVVDAALWPLVGEEPPVHEEVDQALLMAN